MSDDRHQTRDCLDAETLAAFTDGRLEPREREAVETHLAECEDCYEVWMETAATHTTETAAPAPRTRRPWLAGVALAAAVVVAAVWTWPLLRPRDPVVVARDGLVAAVGTARFSEARLSADFAWGEAPSVTRGAAVSLPVPINQAALTASTVADTHQTALAYRVAAAGHLVLGKHDEAIAALEAAALLGIDEGLVQLDLGAALLERYRHRQRPSDAADALDATERAASLLGAHAAATFNRALALEVTGRLEEALDAWDAYLALDAVSPWAAEARDRRAQVQARIGGPPLTGVSGLTQSEMQTLATAEPWRVLDYLDRVMLPGWSDGILSGEQPPLTDGLALAAALKSAGRDHYPHDLLLAIEAIPEARRREAAEAVRTLQGSRTAFNLSRYAEAESAATAAAAIFRRIGVPPHDAEMQAAFAQYFGGDRTAAVERSRQVAGTAEPLGYLRLAGRAAYISGQSLTGSVDLSAALATLQRAVDLYTRAGDRAQVAATRSQLMLAATSAGQHEDAWHHAAESVAALNSLAAPRLRYMVLSNLQYHLRDARRFYAALALGPRLQSLADSWNDPVYSADVALLQAGTHQRLGQEQHVQQTVAVARAHTARISDTTTRSQYDHALDFVEARAFHSSAPATALPALDRIVDYLITHDRPLQMAEAYLLRGRAHAALGAPAEAESDWTRGLAVIEREQTVLKEPHLAVARADRQWDLYAALIDHHHDDAVRNLGIAERARARGLLSGEPGADDDTSQVSNWLPADMTVLVYAVLDNALGVWTVQRGNITFEKRNLPAEGLDAAVTRFGQALGAHGLTADGRLLASLLLPKHPFSSARLVVIPDGPLHRLPFGALRAGDGRLVVESVELSMAPSLLWLKRSVESPQPRSKRALLVGFGGDRSDLGLSALPRVSVEIGTIAGLYGDDATRLEGAAATADAVSERVHSYGVVHIAGHAVADDRRPWESRIFLAPTTRRHALTVSDISRLRLERGSLVILSACSTAGGTVFRGEGVISLARPFLAAGASAVLASLWPVRDDDAERVMVAVHHELNRGASLAAALTTVQRAEVQTRPERWQPWMVLGATHSSDSQR